MNDCSRLAEVSPERLQQTHTFRPIERARHVFIQVEKRLGFGPKTDITNQPPESPMTVPAPQGIRGPPQDLAL